MKQLKMIDVSNSFGALLSNINSDNLPAVDRMKNSWGRVFILMLLSSFSMTVQAQRTASVSGPWESTATWGGQSIPTAADAVTINAGVTVTVNSSTAACASLQLSNANGTATLTFATTGTPALKVSGATTVGGGSPNRVGVITFTSVALIETGSLAIGNASNQASSVSMLAGGNLKVNGAITTSGTGATWTPGIGTVELTANNTLPASIVTSFNNLIISGGTTTLGVSLNSVAVTGSLSVKAGATLSLSTFSYGATTAIPAISLECGGASSGAVISGTGSLYVGGNINVTDNTGGTAAASVSCPLAMSISPTITVADDGTSANDLTIGGVISGSFGITKSGTGTMTLSGANTYTGSTTISAGTLRVNNSTALGTVASGTTVASGAALDMFGTTYSLSEPLTINGTGILSGGVVVNSSATDASFPGLLTLGSSSSIITDFGAIDFTNIGTITGAGLSLTLGGSGSSSISSIIGTTSGTVTKSGTGTWTLSGANTFTGAVTISGGILKLGVSSSSSTSGPLGTNAGGVTVSSGASLDMNGFSLTGTATEALSISGTGVGGVGALTNTAATTSTYIGVITFTANASIEGEGGLLNITGIPASGTTTITLGGAVGGTISTVIAGTRAVVKESAGTWTLSGANTFAGGVTISAGILKLGVSSSSSTSGPLGTNAGGVTVSSGASLDMNGFSLTGTATEALSISGTGVGGIGALTNTAATTSTYIGVITFTANASIEGEGGLLNITGTPASGTTAITLGGAVGGTISTVIAGARTLVKESAGTWTLSGANTFTGAVTISAGILKLGASSSVSTSGPLGTNAGGVTVSSGASLDMNGFSLTSAATEALSLSGAGASGVGALTNSSATAVTYIGVITFTDNATISGEGGLLNITGTPATGTTTITLGGAAGGTISTVIAGARLIVKEAAGTWTLSGTNTFSGGFTLNAGRINLNNTNALGAATGSLTINSGSIDNTSVSNISTPSYPIVLNGDFTFLGSANRTLNLGTGAVTVNQSIQITVSASTLTMGGALSGSAQNITKAGAGVLSLGSSSASLNTLTISAGTFISTSGTLTLAGNFSNSATFTANSGTVNFNGTSIQDIGGSSTTAFSSVTISNDTADITTSANITVSGTLTINSGARLVPSATKTIGGGGTLTGAGTACVTRITATADFITQYTITTKTISGLTVEYRGAGNQSINNLTYNNLTVSNTGTKTAGGAFTVNNIFTISSGATVNMQALALSGTNITTSGTGVLQTQALTSAIPTGKTWSFTVSYNATTGGQTIIAGTYAGLSLANTSGIQTAGGNLSVNNSLDISSGSTLNMTAAYTLGGTLSTINNSGTIKTAVPSSTSTVPVASGKTWTGTIEFNATANSGNNVQTVPLGAYTNLTINAGDGAVAGASISVAGVLSLQSTYATATKGCFDFQTDIPYELTMGAGASTIGNGDVTGIVTRNSFALATPYTFGSTYTIINFSSRGPLGTEPFPSWVKVKVVKTATHTWKTDAVNRYYDITTSQGNTATAVLNTTLHYNTAELNGTTEALLNYFDVHYPVGGGTLSVHDHGASNRDATNKFIGLSNWTLAYFAPSSSWDVKYYTLGTSTNTNLVFWHGSNSADWSNPLNWSTNALPGVTSNVVIGQGSNAPVLPTSLSVNSIYIESGATLNGGSGTLTLAGGSGAWINAGTFNPGTSTVVFTNAAATLSAQNDFYNLTVNSGAKLTLGTSSVLRIAGAISNLGIIDASTNETTIEYTGANQVVINPNGGTTAGYHNLILSGTGNISLPSEKLTIRGDFTNNYSNQLRFTNLVEFAGPALMEQDFNGTRSTLFDSLKINLNGSHLNQNANISVKKLFLTTGTISMAANMMLTVSDTLIKDGTGQIDAGALGAMLVFANTNLLTIPAGTLADTISNLSISGGGKLILSANQKIGSSLNISSGTLDIGSYSLDATGSGSLSIANGAALSIGGTSTFPSNYSTHSIGKKSTIEYYGTNQVISVLNSSQQYGNLVLSGTGTKSLAGNIVVANSLNLTSGTLDLGAYTANAADSGTLTIANATILKIGGTNTLPSNYSTHSIGNTSTIEYSGTDQTIAALKTSQSYGNLVLSGSGNKQLGGDVAVTGNWTRSATNTAFAHNKKKVTFTGALSSVISAPNVTQRDAYGVFGGETFFDMEINKSAKALTVGTGVANAANNIAIRRTLSLVKGTLNLGDSNVVLISKFDTTADVSAVNSNDAAVNYAGNGRVVVQRFISNPTAVRTWRYLTAPLQADDPLTINQAWQGGVTAGNPWPGYGTTITGVGGTANGFDSSIQNKYSIQFFNNTTTPNSWGYPANTNVRLMSKPAWVIFIRGDRSASVLGPYNPAGDLVLEPKGKINIGDTSYVITSGKFNLIGNPYPSRIKMNTVTDAANNPHPPFRLWDPKAFSSYSQTGAYVLFRYLAGAYQQVNNAGTTWETPGTIESGQAIMIDTLLKSTAIKFHESDKIAGTSTLNGIKSRPETAPNQLVGFYTKLGFLDTATVLYKYIDGVSNLYNSDFYSGVLASEDFIAPTAAVGSIRILKEGYQLYLDAEEQINDGDTIFYTTKLNRGKHRLAFYMKNVDPSLQPWVEDTYSGVQLPIRVTDTDSTFLDFEVTADVLSNKADRFRVIFKSNVSLPTKFISISANQHSDAIAVKWVVANQINIKLYEIERSANGSDYATAGTILALHSNSDLISYDWMDEAPFSENNYYRVKCVATDGSFTYSTIVKIKNGRGASTVFVYPNPVKNKFVNLQFNNQPSGNYQLKLYSMSGQLLLNKTINGAGGNWSESIMLGTLFPKGNYQLTVDGPLGKKYRQTIFVD